MRLALRCLLGFTVVLLLVLPACLSSLQDGQAAALRAAAQQQSQPQSYCAPSGSSTVEGWLSLTEATRLALAVGWSRSVVESGVLGAVMITESGGDSDGDGSMEVNTGAANPSSSARGLMQIMTSLHGNLIEQHGGDVFDAAGNLRMALDLYDESLAATGDGWLPWEGYTTGRYTQHLDEARAAASGLLGAAQPAPAPSGLRDDFAEVGRTMRDGGGDHFWYLDHNGVTASVIAPGVLAHGGNSTYRMWAQDAVSGSFTIKTRMRVTRMTSDNNLGGGNSTDPGLKILIKQPAAGDGTGPAAARGSGGGRNSDVGNYALPVSTYSGETFIAKRPLAASARDYSFEGSARGLGTVEGEWADVTVQVEQQPDGVRLTYWINGRQVATRSDTDAPMQGPYYVGVRSDGVAWEIDFYEVLGGVIEPSGATCTSTSLVGLVSPEGLACPVPGGRFTNDWGFPRSGGRTHQGNDVFAPTGSPAVAIEDGVIDKGNYSPRGLGGITLWLSGDSGTRYYYAHNDYNIAAIGQRVRAGEQIAAVGRTGNAASTPPHVHFEVHPGGGRAVNPYPLLTTLCA